MSVEQQLGLDPNMEDLIAESWSRWAAQRPTLVRVVDPRGLRRWVQTADPDVADDVVHELAWLASVQGADDREAALVLAWLLVPGASFVARQLRSLSPDIDHLVAGELWILVRTFPLQRRKVIVNLMRDLRSRVLAVCEAPATLRRTDPTWFAATLSIEAAAVQALPSPQRSTSLDDLVDVLDWACEQHVIDAADRQLVLLLVEASQDLDTRVCSSQGLLADAATAEVAAQLGVCQRTVRRRARRSLQALTATAHGYSRAA